MKNTKRILSLLLAVMMTLSMAVIAGADNVSFTDVAGHWAWTGGQIPYLVSKNVLNGYKQADGTYTFNPDGQVTRAEFIKMLDETFGLKTTVGVSYSDVKDTDWYAPYIGKAAAQGYLLNYGSMIDPNGKLSREEAISLLVRYLDLPADYQESPSYFADYASISENFRSYIMEAVYAGVTDGYMESGSRKFQPQRILTRAEALTILYRAAGAVFNGTVSARDYGAAGSNNTFVTGGTTVISDLNFEGRNIVSEGAEAGTLTFMNCKFIGPLTVRGDADVIFYNCTAGEVTLQGNGIFSLLDRSSVNSLRVEKADSVNVNSGTSVKDLTVAPSASALNIKGDGTIGHALVQATGLVSTIMPMTFEVGTGLSAAFAGVTAIGSSSELDSFEAAPFVYSDGTNACLAVKPTGAGTVYAYYTNDEFIPSTELYDSYYEASPYAFHFSANSGVWSSGSGHTMATVGGFRYLVVQLKQDARTYRPVVVPCEYASNTGFMNDPKLLSNTMTVRAGQAGNIWWFYTDNASKLTSIEFLNAWDKTDASLRGTGTVKGSTDFNIALNDKGIQRGYIALMLKNAANGYYQPLIVGVGYTGFSKNPEVKTAGTIRYTAAVSGTMYYYFSSTPDAPTADKFLAEYNAAQNRSTVTVRPGSDSELKFDTEILNRYTYMILAIRTQAGDFYQPVLLNVFADTGFDTDPAVRREGEIRFYTKKAGTVKYYYSTNASAPTSEEFNSTWSKTETTYRDSMRVTANRDYTINYYVQYARTRPYLVIMFTDEDGTDYSPVLLELFNNTGTGFLTNPYNGGKEIVFTTEKDGQVFMFYTTSSSAMAAEDFYTEYKNARFRDAVSVKGGVPNSFFIDSEARRINRYAVLAFIPADAELNNRNFYYPFILDLEGEPEDDHETGLSTYVDTENRRVMLSSAYTGTVYYYFTDYESDLPLDTSFSSHYNYASGASSITVTVGIPKSIDVDSHRYVVLCLNATVDRKNKSFAPCIVDMSAGIEYSDGLNDGANMNTTGFESVSISSNQTVSFIPSVSGTANLLIVKDGVTSFTGISAHAKAGEKASVSLAGVPDVVLQMMKGGTCYLQLSADNGDVYRAYKLFDI